MFDGDSSETSISGEIYSSPKGIVWLLDHDGDDDDFVQASAANFTYDLHNDNSRYTNFQLYNTKTSL